MQTTVGIIASCSDCNKINDILSPIRAKQTYCATVSEIYFDTSKGVLKYIEMNNNSYISYIESEYKEGILHISQEKIEINPKVLSIIEKTQHKKCSLSIKSESFLIDEIYIHIEQIKELGCFIRIESIAIKNDFHRSELQSKCNFFIKKLEINAKDIIKTSYHELSKQNDLFMQMYIK